MEDCVAAGVGLALDRRGRNRAGFHRRRAQEVEERHLCGEADHSIGRPLCRRPLFAVAGRG